MNYYRYTVSFLKETVKIEVLEKNTKRKIPDDNFEDIEYNKEGDCILTLYAENKEQAHFTGMWLMQEVGAQDREEIKEETRQKLIFEGIKHG